MINPHKLGIFLLFPNKCLRVSPVIIKLITGDFNMKKFKYIVGTCLFAMSIGALSGCDAANQIASMATDIQSQITDLQSDVDALKKEVDDLKKQIADLEKEMDDSIAEVEADFSTKIKATEDNISSMQKDINDLTAKLEADKKALTDDYNEKITNLKNTHDADIAAIRTDYDNQLITLKNNYDSQLASLEADYKAQIIATKEEYDAKLAALETDYKNKINAAKDEFDTKIANFKSDYDSQLATLTNDYNTKINNFQATYQTKVAEIEGSIATERARITALESEMANQVTAIQNDYNGKINSLTGRVAELEKIQYHTVSFDTKGGNDIDSVVVIHGDKVKKPVDPTKVGSTFKGWSYLDDPWYFSGYSVTEDMTLTANWEQINYTATFKNDDGSVLKTLENVHYGDNLTYPGSTPIKANQDAHYAYSFAGWDKDLTVTGDMVFNAQYDSEYLPYQEKYLGTDGSVIFSRYVKEEDQSVDISFNGMELTPKQKKVLLEAEEGVTTGDAQICTSEMYHNGSCIGWFHDGSTLTMTFTASHHFSSHLYFSLSAPSAVGRKLNSYVKLFINNEQKEISDSVVFQTSYDWDYFEVLDLGSFDFDSGENKVKLVPFDGLNVDYMCLDTNTFEIEDYGIETPHKDNQDGLKYCFRNWEEVSNENDVTIYQPHFEAATIGLNFVENTLDSYSGAATEINVPSWWNGYHIKEIKNDAFAYCDIETVNLGDGILKIGERAFYKCKSLATINFPSSLKTIYAAAFQDCSALESIDLNEGLEQIYNAAFQCSGLRRVVIPSTVTTIYDWAFYDIRADFIYIPASVAHIYMGAFSSSSYYQNTVFCEREYRPSFYTSDWATDSNIVWGYQSIVEKDGYKYAITEIEGVQSAVLMAIDSSVTNFVVPEKVNDVTVADMVVNFRNNRNIQTVVLPSFFAKVSEKMFENCSNLTSITLTSVVTIGNYAFLGCTKLATVDFGSALTSVGDHAFEGCDLLASVVLPDGFKRVGDCSFRNCSALTSVYLPESTTTIEGGAFENDTSLVTFNMPSKLKSIAMNSFCRTAIRSMILADGLDKIASGVFSQCHSLEWIVIPTSVTRIEAYCFYDCPSLTKVYYRGNAEEWEVISHYDGTNAQLDGTTKYYYLEDEPQEAGNYWHYVAGVPTAW